MPVVLQTATAQIGLWSVACGDGRGIDRRQRCIPRMSHAARIGLRSWIVSLGSAAVTAARGADLASPALLSDRSCPLITLPNGPLMARRSRANLGWRPKPVRVPCSSPILLVAACPWL